MSRDGQPDSFELASLANGLKSLKRILKLVTEVQAKQAQVWIDWRVGDVKTKYSRKRVPLDSALANVLRSFKEQSAGSAKATTCIFANPETRKPWDSYHAQVRIGPAGVGPIGWHTLRHSYSTLLRSMKVDVEVQQELLRHADISTT